MRSWEPGIRDSCLESFSQVLCCCKPPTSAHRPLSTARGEEDQVAELEGFHSGPPASVLAQEAALPWFCSGRGASGLLAVRHPRRATGGSCADGRAPHKAADLGLLSPSLLEAIWSWSTSWGWVRA